MIVGFLVFWSNDSLILTSVPHIPYPEPRIALNMSQAFKHAFELVQIRNNNVGKRLFRGTTVMGTDETKILIAAKGDKGNDLRRNVEELSRKLRGSHAECGSSWKAMSKFSKL